MIQWQGLSKGEKKEYLSASQVQTDRGNREMFQLYTRDGRVLLCKQVQCWFWPSEYKTDMGRWVAGSSEITTARPPPKHYLSTHEESKGLDKQSEKCWPFVVDCHLTRPSSLLAAPPLLCVLRSYYITMMASEWASFSIGYIHWRAYLQWVPLFFLWARIGCTWIN